MNNEKQILEHISHFKAAFILTSKVTVQTPTHLVRQNFLPEGSTEIQSLQHRVTVAGVAELEKRSRVNEGQ